MAQPAFADEAPLDAHVVAVDRTSGVHGTWTGEAERIDVSSAPASDATVRVTWYDVVSAGAVTRPTSTGRASRVENRDPASTWG